MLICPRTWSSEADQVQMFLHPQQHVPVVAKIYTHIYPRGGIAFARVFD
jgi:hypothetical protein